MPERPSTSARPNRSQGQQLGQDLDQDRDQAGILALAGIFLTVPLARADTAVVVPSHRKTATEFIRDLGQHPDPFPSWEWCMGSQECVVAQLQELAKEACGPQPGLGTGVHWNIQIVVNVALVTILVTDIIHMSRIGCRANR